MFFGYLKYLLIKAFSLPVPLKARRGNQSMIDNFKEKIAKQAFFINYIC
jgi:hypothetical protein